MIAHACEHVQAFFKLFLVFVLVHEGLATEDDVRARVYLLQSERKIRLNSQRLSLLLHKPTYSYCIIMIYLLIYRWLLNLIHIRTGDLINLAEAVISSSPNII